MQQCPFGKANRSSASQEILHILWNQKGHYLTYNSLLHVLILSHTNPIHASSFHFFKIHFNIMFSFMPRSSTWCLSLRSLHQNSVCTSPISIRATCPTNFILLDLIPQILGEVYRSQSSSLRSFLHFTVTSPTLGPNTFLSTLFSNTLSLCLVSGFCCEADENCALLGYYAASSGNFLPTLHDNLLVPSSGVKNILPSWARQFSSTLFVASAFFPFFPFHFHFYCHFVFPLPFP